jgi:glycosyltransferase involved in cell wall biosynthesis
VRAITNRIERWCVNRCDALIANTQGAADRYRELYPQAVNKITHIYNGVVLQSLPAVDPSPHFKMVYCGALYNESFLDLLFDSAKRAFPTEPFEIVFTGDKKRVIDRAAQRWGVTDHVTQTGFVSREEVDRHMSSASLLLFHNGFKQDGSLNKFVIKSKLYDYLATGKPLLALAPTGEVSDMIQRYSPGSRIISADFSTKYPEQLRAAFDDWTCCSQVESLPDNRREFMHDFSPECLTEKFVAVLNQVVSRDTNQLGRQAYGVISV